MKYFTKTAMGDNPYNMGDEKMNALISGEAKKLKKLDLKNSREVLKHYSENDWSVVPKMTLTDRQFLVRAVGKRL